jgi:hypothetical protein
VLLSPTLKTILFIFTTMKTSKSLTVSDFIIACGLLTPPYPTKCGPYGAETRKSYQWYTSTRIFRHKTKYSGGQNWTQTGATAIGGGFLSTEKNKHVRKVGQPTTQTESYITSERGRSNSTDNNFFDIFNRGPLSFFIYFFRTSPVFFLTLTCVTLKQ